MGGRRVTTLKLANLSHTLPPPRTIFSVDVVADKVTFETGVPTCMSAKVVAAGTGLELAVSYGLVRITQVATQRTLTTPLSTKFTG